MHVYSAGLHGKRGDWREPLDNRGLQALSSELAKWLTGDLRTKSSDSRLHS
jgi:hypothetical protein